MDADDRPLEGQGQTIDVALEPCLPMRCFSFDPMELRGVSLPGSHAVDEYPLFMFMFLQSWRKLGIRVESNCIPVQSPAE